jgi:hypothetical protein
VPASSLYAPRAATLEAPDWSSDDESEVFRTMDAVRLALEPELETDPEVFLAGIDVGKGGNVFALTRGLYDRWPDRLLDTPISETAVIGLGVGAAMAFWAQRRVCILRPRARLIGARRGRSGTRCHCGCPAPR